jgi:hypothetical protein
MSPTNDATVVMLFFDRWRGFRARFDRRLRALLGRERIVRDVSLHEVDDEYLHIDYVFPVGRRILLVDLIDYRGHVFGAETLRQWTVLDRGRRHVFDNPLMAAHNKREALRNLLGETPVYESYLVFPDETTFGRDLPGNVLCASPFFQKLESVRADGSEPDNALPWDELAKKIEDNRLL